MSMCMLSCVRLFVTSWLRPTRLLYTWNFPRLEYWNGLPFPPPGNLPDFCIELTSLASPILAGGFLTTALPGKVVKCAYSFYCSQVFRLFVLWGYIVMNILVLIF